MSIFDRHFDKYSYFCYNPIKINHKRSLMRKENMLISERHQKYWKFYRRKRPFPQKLMEILYVSEATLRRDLTKMEQKGLIKRTYGGAMIVESIANESSILIREQKQVSEKEKLPANVLNSSKTTNLISSIPAPQSGIFFICSTICRT